MRRERGGREAGRDAVISHLNERVLADRFDTYFFLGNMMRYPHVFSIVGQWYPKKESPGLFDEID